MKRILFFYLILTIIIGTPISWYAWPKSIPHPMSPSDMRLYYRGFGFNDGTGLFGRRWYAVTFDPEYDGSHWQFEFIEPGYNPFKAYYADGTLQQEGECLIEVMGFENGPYPDWHDLRWANCYRPDGSLGSEVINGTGTQTQWMQDGTKTWELELVNYQRAAHTMWYPNGQLQQHQEYRNGLGRVPQVSGPVSSPNRGCRQRSKNANSDLCSRPSQPVLGLTGHDLVHGPYVGYYPSGVKKTEGAYDAGWRVGIWTRYNEDGSVESSESN